MKKSAIILQQTSVSLPHFSHTQKVLANAFFCATLFPFASPIPIQTDTQPVAFLFALFLLISLSFQGHKLTYVELLILLFPIFGLIYINPFVGNPMPDQIGKYFSLLTGSIVYVAARRVFHLFSSKTFYNSIVVYFICTLLLMVAPDTFFNIQAMFVRAVNTAGEENPFGYRGIPTLSTEPGLFGGVLIFHFFLLEFFKRNNQLVKKQYLECLAMLCFMVLATKSGTGYLYFFLYVAYLIIRQKKGLLKISLGLVVFITLISIVESTLDSSSDLGRGFQIISGVLVQPEVLMSDTSTIGRLYDFFLGFVSLYEHPLGNGVNGVDRATLLISNEYSFLRDYYGVSVIGLVSGLAWCLVAYGVLALIYLIYVYVASTKASIGARIFSLIFLSFSYSPAFPGIWILLALPAVRIASR